MKRKITTKNFYLILIMLVSLIRADFAIGQTLVVKGNKPWTSIESSIGWKNSEASSGNVVIKDGIALDKVGEGYWTSKWFERIGRSDSVKLNVFAGMDMFINSAIDTVVNGSKKPFTDADGVAHDWYGRCMITIIDSTCWIMAIRSGIDHINWEGRDAIHLLTSTDEGKTWGKLNKWFDGTAIKGMPYEDGEQHSEPGIYKMPNGDLILQFWRKNYANGTKQLRSRDNGKTWQLDHEQITIEGAPGKIGTKDAFPIGTQNCVVDPEHPNDIYMAFEYYFYKADEHHGTILAKSTDNCKSFTFLSWILPPEYNNFEPTIEYLGNRTIIAVVRGSDDMHTWQAISTNMGAGFEKPIDISDQVNGGVPNGVWQRPRLYKESNPDFQINCSGSYANGDGRLWGFGIHNNGKCKFPQGRKPVAYWSDDNGNSWYGPQLLHGPMYPGTDTGYGDMKRRRDGTFVASTYYSSSRERLDVSANVEKYTFNVQSAKFMIETDKNGDGIPEPDSLWQELHNGYNIIGISGANNCRWRIKLLLNSPKGGYTDYPIVYSIKVVQ